MAECKIETPKMTVEEFLVWAEAQASGRYELFDGEIIAMAPERARHALTKGDVYLCLRNAVARAKLPCKVFPDGMTVKINDFTSYEPDAAVRCGGNLKPDDMILNAPIIVVEVMSPSSKRLDTHSKLSDYFRVPSIHHYLIIDADRRIVIHHARSDGGALVTKLIQTGAIHLDPPGLALDFDALIPQLD